MSQKQYAEHCCKAGCPVSQQAISKAVRLGKIPVTGAGLIDSDVADTAWRARRGQRTEAAIPEPAADAQEVASPGSAVPQQPTLVFAAPQAGTPIGEQAALARARREKIEWDMRRDAGEFVLFRDALHAWAEMTIAARNRVLSVVDEILDPATAALVDRLLREALDDITKMPAIDFVKAAAA